MYNASLIGRFSPQVPTFSTHTEHPGHGVNADKNKAVYRHSDELAFLCSVKISNGEYATKYLQKGVPPALASRALHDVRRVDVFRMLLDANADINYVGPKGFSPLMMSINHKRLDVAEAMIDAKADVNYTTDDGHCALSCAVVHSPSFTEVLCAAGAEIPTDPIGTHDHSFIHFAIHRNAHSIVEAMLPWADRTAVDAMGNNLVATAALNADEKMMRLVLQHSTVDQVNAANHGNTTPIELAALFNTTDVVRLLLDAKAEVARSGCEPITIKAMIGSTHGRAKCRKLLPTLVEAGADVNARNDKGFTALHVAAFRGLENDVGILLSLKADVTSTDNRGVTPLLAAISKGNTAVVESLLAAGGTVSGVLGGQRLITAALRGNEASVAILIKVKANLDYKAKGGFTPLKSALNARHLHIVKKLIAAGADTVKDRKGLLRVCRVRNIDPAVIDVTSGKSEEAHRHHRDHRQRGVLR
jgi:ankyrin repeat protein